MNTPQACDWGPSHYANSANTFHEYLKVLEYLQRSADGKARVKKQLHTLRQQRILTAHLTKKKDTCPRQNGYDRPLLSRLWLRLRKEKEGPRKIDRKDIDERLVLSQRG